MLPLNCTALHTQMFLSLSAASLTDRAIETPVSIIGPRGPETRAVIWSDRFETNQEFVEKLI